MQGSDVAMWNLDVDSAIWMLFCKSCGSDVEMWGYLRLCTPSQPHVRPRHVEKCFPETV